MTRVWKICPTLVKRGIYPVKADMKRERNPTKLLVQPLVLKWGKEANLFETDLGTSDHPKF